MSFTGNTHAIGDQVRCYTSQPFQNDSGVATDPTTVTFTLVQPGLAPLVYVYGVGAQVVRDGIGNYHVDVIPIVSGMHTYTFAGTGAVQRAAEYEFLVKLPPF